MKTTKFQKLQKKNCLRRLLRRLWKEKVEFRIETETGRHRRVKASLLWFKFLKLIKRRRQALTHQNKTRDKVRPRHRGKALARHRDESRDKTRKTLRLKERNRRRRKGFQKTLKVTLSRHRNWSRKFPMLSRKRRRQNLHHQSHQVKNCNF